MLIKVTVKDGSFKAPGEDSRNKNQQKTDLMKTLKFMVCQEPIFPYNFFGFLWKIYFVELRSQNAIKILLS